MYSLNDEQKQAVIQVDGPILILAGAGTGKTKTLVSRIGNLVEQGHAEPYEIMAVTFTNKAASELKDRILELTQIPVKDWVGTFHSIAAKILRRHPEEAGLTQNFTIIDQDDQISLLKNIISDNSPVAKDKKEIRIIANIIQRWKEKALNPSAVTDVNSEIKKVAWQYYPLYQERLKLANSVDFSDLLLHNINLFNEYPQILHLYQDKIKYIMVDEYQDTNTIQYLWLRLLAQKHKNICCVGDDDQSIYSWRGAEISNILRFSKDFVGAKVIKLERNYRSTSHILAVADAIISQNEGRLGKTLWTEEASGQRVKIAQYHSDREEAMSILQTVYQQYSNAYQETAILVRGTAQTRVLEEYCTHYNIPYQIIGGMKFYDRKEIKDIIAYLKIAVNPSDDAAFERIVNTPKRGIGQATMKKIYYEAINNHSSLVQAANILVEQGIIKSGRLKTLLQQISEWNSYTYDATCQELAEKVLECSGYLDMLKDDSTDEGKDRLDHVKEILGMMQGEYNDSNKFLEHISLVTTTDDLNQNGYLSIMTLHAAKGLEFDNVFLPGWEEEVFPHIRSIHEHNVEEERRLAYVGVTRARKNLYISYARSRFMYKMPLYNHPSRFLKNLPKEHTEKVISHSKQNHYSMSFLQK